MRYIAYYSHWIVCYVICLLFSRISPRRNILLVFVYMPLAVTLCRHIGIRSFSHVTTCYHSLIVSSQPPSCGFHCLTFSGTATPPSRRSRPHPSGAFRQLGQAVCRVRSTSLAAGCHSLSVPV